MKPCDYVIVGGGPAACVLALRLSADPSCRVVLIEAGPARRSLAARLVARWTHAFNTGLLWRYETVPQTGMNGRRMYLPQGRTLGGGSAVNAMTYVRGHPSDYDGWRAAGNTGWGWDTVLPAFKRLEHNHAIADEFHSQGGPLHVSDQVRPHVLTRAFVDAARELGLPENRDFNGVSQDGLGFYQVTQRRGRRCSAADAFLHPARHRKNLTVLTGTCATKVVVSGGRAIGVEVRRAGRTEIIRAGAEVLVSGGAVNSPKLLLLSGIGPADELGRLGIAVVHDSPGMGRNLQDHLNVQVISRCRRPITYDHWDRPLRFLKFGLQYLLFNTGIATSNLCEGGGFLRSARCATPAPDIQLHFMPIIWLDYGRTEVEGYGMTLEAAYLRPESRGSVRLASLDPAADPLIDPRYCTEPDDLRVLVEAIRRGREIMRTDALGAFTSGELQPEPDRRSDEDLAAYVRESAITAYHPVGTCRMGIDELAVVDPRLRVRGVEGLRVVDSSVMPRIVSGSTQAPSMMIGEMGAAMILADRR